MQRKSRGKRHPAGSKALLGGVERSAAASPGICIPACGSAQGLTTPSCRGFVFGKTNKAQSPSHSLPQAFRSKSCFPPLRAGRYTFGCTNPGESSLEDFLMLSVMNITGIISFNRPPSPQAVSRCCTENKASPLRSTGKVLMKLRAFLGSRKIFVLVPA